MGVQALKSHAKGDKHRFRDGTMAGSDTLGLVQCTLDTQINRPKPKQSEPFYFFIIRPISDLIN